MTDFRIEIGKGDGSRYIGVKPPVLDIAERDQILEVLSENSEDLILNTLARGNGFRTVRPFRGPEYSEMGFDVSRLYDNSTSIEEIAEKIAEVLRSTDNKVTVDPDIKPVGFGLFLFGGKAEAVECSVH